MAKKIVESAPEKTEKKVVDKKRALPLRDREGKHIGKVEPKPLIFRVSNKEKLIFAKNLAVMINAGIPMQEAFIVMHEQIESPSLRYFLDIAIQDLAEGQVLAHALRRFPKIFDPFFINLISVGEESGTLPSSLLYLATQIEKSIDLQTKVRSALVYPIIIFVGAVGVGIYLSFFLLPQLTPLFHSMDLKLPITTKILLATTQWFRDYWYIVLGIFVFLGIIFKLLMTRPLVQYAVAYLFLRFPVFGNLTRNVQTTLFSRVLGTLLASGIHVVPALKITAGSLSNPVYSRAVSQIGERVDRGETIVSYMQTIPSVFSRTTTSIIGIGEGTGKLADSLLSLADFSEREVDVLTRNLATLIEPLVLVAVGLLVGFIALSIISPIYQLTQGFSH